MPSHHTHTSGNSKVVDASGKGGKASGHKAVGGSGSGGNMKFGSNSSKAGGIYRSTGTGGSATSRGGSAKGGAGQGGDVTFD